MFRPFVFFSFLWVFSPFSAAQFGGLYDFDDFGTFTLGPKSHVTLKSQFIEEYLVVEASISSGWHLYSVTQPEGATIRGTFEFETPGLNLLEIRPTTAPNINNSPYFDVDLEEHDDSVTWILTFQDKLPSDATIKGRFRGQVCDDEDGMCVQVNVAFEAVFDANLDVASLQAQAESVAERFVVRVGEITEAPPEVAIDSQNAQNAVIPAQAGIQTEDVNVNSLAPRFRGGDGKDDAATFTLQGITFTPQETVQVTTLWWALVLAFLGGIILNIMPCVLPIIGLKILSFFEQAGKSRARAFMLNAYYSLGILSVFLFLAFLSLGLSKLFTFDLFNIIMACVVFVMALSLMDVWTLNVPGALGGKTSDKLTSQEGVLGAYFKGIITTLLAIPCGAPLLSPAINWADIQIRSGNMPEVFLMYAVIGLGMASPYLLLGAFPEWLRFLPKPGEWMETFKKIMGFCLLLAVVWILYFVQMEKLLPTVTLLFALWFVCWLYGHQQLTGRVKKRSYGISAVVVGLAILVSYQIPGIPNSYTLESAMQSRIMRMEDRARSEGFAEGFTAGEVAGKTEVALTLESEMRTWMERMAEDITGEFIAEALKGMSEITSQLGLEIELREHQKDHWKPYSAAAFESALASDKMVIIDFTADWCVNCKVLEATILRSTPILEALDEKGIVSLMADCTREGEATELLRQLGPEQVPVLAIFDPADPSKPTVMRGMYTQGKLLELLK
ncbi:MAG: thioredoxin family protein [Planctomycetaceae bacterium]|nr:thioredoxin family protein [Planctomycetaceae bacterium]